MAFNCRQCGSCCMYMGDYITIEQQRGHFEFECVSVSTGTPFSVRVDSEKRELFLDHTWIDLHPRACRFLRPAGGRIVCTVHETSAVQCKIYRCEVMRVFSREGSYLGKVTGTLSLHTGDARLREVWEEGKRGIPWSAPDAEDRIARYLMNKGYQVR